MELARTVPEIAAILRERNAFGIEMVAGMVGQATDREPDDPEVLLFSGIVLGARHAARARMDAGRGERYVDEFDAMLGRLGAGIPLADEPVRAPGVITSQSSS
jgi:hypothetical protein